MASELAVRPVVVLQIEHDGFKSLRLHGVARLAGSQHVVLPGALSIQMGHVPLQQLLVYYLRGLVSTHIYHITTYACIQYR